MTHQSNCPLIQMDKQQVADLCKEEKETLAVGLSNGNNKAFGTVDLWNIERQRKSRVQNRRMLSLVGQ